jgi:hypothetical protein
LTTTPKYGIVSLDKTFRKHVFIPPPPSKRWGFSLLYRKSISANTKYDILLKLKPEKGGK